MRDTVHDAAECNKCGTKMALAGENTVEDLNKGVECPECGALDWVDGGRVRLM